MTGRRIPWEVVETFPSSDAELLADWEAEVTDADGDASMAHALIGRALASYWAVQEGVLDEPWAEVADGRTGDLDQALRLARGIGDPSLVAEALLGQLYGTWGPERLLRRGPVVDELRRLRPQVTDPEIRLRSIEFEVVRHLDRGDRDAVEIAIAEFAREALDADPVMLERRVLLWRGCLAMLDGDIDGSVRTNLDAISATADIAGSPFSFQNVAITVAIERYLRGGLADTVDAIRSVRASSPRVGANWDSGLAFALSEVGRSEEAAVLFERLAVDRFERLPRDLNWLVTMHVLGLVAINLDDARHGAVVLELLRPFAELDSTHGSGYASYGPVGRVVGALAARWGDPDEADRWFGYVLATRPPGPWTSLTRYDRALATHRREPERSYEDAVLAAKELRTFGMSSWATRAETLATEIRSHGLGAPTAVRDGLLWTLRHPSGRATIRVGVGADRLLEMLRRAGEILDVFDLDPAADPRLPTEATTESTLDRVAVTAYRRRIDQLERRTRRSPADDDELSHLRRALAGNRHRTSTSAEVERARVRVTKSIRRTIDEIDAQSPALAGHLRSSLSTGRTCLYQPYPLVPWLVIERS